MNKVLIINTLILGIGLSLFALISQFHLAMLFAVIFGYGAMTQTTICLTIVQVHTDPNMRGRVMSYLIMAMTGVLPLGSLLVGLISQQIGAPHTLFVQGIIAIIIAVVSARFFNRNSKSNNLSE